ncbi:VPLPA-CTERM sorting domain-containing protein [Pseudomonadota bacterium]
MKNNGKLYAVVGMLMLAGSISQAHATPVTYDLTYSNNATGHISGNPWSVTNHIPNGTTYATVTIDDMVTSGLINFTVDLSSYWDDKTTGSNFGIQSFGFNLAGAATGLMAADVDDSTLPSNWGATVDLSGTNQDGLGGFDVTINKTGNGQPNRQNPLVFSIDLGGDQSTTDSISDYVADSIAGANGSFLFAVHIAGFDDQNPEDAVGSCIGAPLDANNPDCNYLTSVWVGNSAVVPVPAAVWLFGSGLLGLVGVARRKQA